MARFNSTKSYSLICKYVGRPSEEIPLYKKDEDLLDTMHHVEVLEKLHPEKDGFVPWNVLWCRSRSTIDLAGIASTIFINSRLGYFEVKEIEISDERTLGVRLTERGRNFYN